MLKPVKILSKLYDVPEGWTLRAYERAGGYQAARRAPARARAWVAAQAQPPVRQMVWREPAEPRASAQPRLRSTGIGSV